MRVELMDAFVPLPQVTDIQGDPDVRGGTFARSSGRLISVQPSHLHSAARQKCVRADVTFLTLRYKRPHSPVAPEEQSFGK